MLCCKKRYCTKWMPKHSLFLSSTHTKGQKNSCPIHYLKTDLEIYCKLRPNIFPDIPIGRLLEAGIFTEIVEKMTSPNQGIGIY